MGKDSDKEPNKSNNNDEEVLDLYNDKFIREAIACSTALSQELKAKYNNDHHLNLVFMNVSQYYATSLNHA